MNKVNLDTCLRLFRLLTTYFCDAKNIDDIIGWMMLFIDNLNKIRKKDSTVWIAPCHIYFLKGGKRTHALTHTYIDTHIKYICITWSDVIFQMSADDLLTVCNWRLYTDTLFFNQNVLYVTKKIANIYAILDMHLDNICLTYSRFSIILRLRWHETKVLNIVLWLKCQVELAIN